MSNIESMYAIMNRLSDKSIRNIALWLAEYNQKASK
jgi:cytochrome c553